MVLTKESVIKRDGVDVPHIRVLQEIGINVEEYGHINRLAPVQALLFEAETLDLTEVRSDLGGCDAVGRHANDVLIGRLVGGRVEGQGGLAGQHPDFTLLGCELPGQDVRGAASEGDA